MTLRIGVIAEDTSDVDVLSALIRIKANRPFSIQRYVGHGCGKIVAKCRGWADMLAREGCRFLLVVHDLDEKSLPALRRSLQTALSPSPISTFVIVIPVREIEAWLLADEKAIHKGLKLRKVVKPVKNPEVIRDPKRALKELIHERSEKRVEYVNTIHNLKIAQHCSFAKLRRCTSFIPFESFINAHFVR